LLIAFVASLVLLIVLHLACRPYPVSDVMADLLDVAARTLVMGGRLVYIVPSLSDFAPDDDLPRHDCLRLVHSCFQPLQGELGRRVVAMAKVAEYDAAQRDAYLARIWKNGPESAEKVATIREKLLDAAKKKPRYEEKLAVRRQKRKQNRQAKQVAKRQESAPQGFPG
jgi:tRNA (guanine10-N2)-methyltransferase